VRRSHGKVTIGKFMRLRQLTEVYVVLEIARERVNIAFSLAFTYNPKSNWVFVLPARRALGVPHDQ